MEHFHFITSGTCAREIDYDFDGTTIHNVSFVNGCNGNLKAISKLVEGKTPAEVIAILDGNTCGSNVTSCADQLCRALELCIAK